MAYLKRRRTAPGILIGVVIFHAGLLFVLLNLRSAIVAVAPADSMIYLALVSPPPPVVEIPVEPAAVPETKTPRVPMPPPIRKAPAAVKADAGQPAPPSYEFVAGADWGSAASVNGADGAATGRGQRTTRVPNDYAERVKARVVANLVRPTGATYASAGKPGAASVFRQCTIPYELVVDREGKVVSFHIEPCGDPLLDAAAEAALRKSGPHPPPPHAGAESYVIYGTANFKAP